LNGGDPNRKEEKKAQQQQVCKGEKGGIGQKKKKMKKNIAIHLKAICDAAWGQIKSGDIKKPFFLPFGGY
jgi:hypothetical protein